MTMTENHMTDHDLCVMTSQLSKEISDSLDLPRVYVKAKFDINSVDVLGKCFRLDNKHSYIKISKYIANTIDVRNVMLHELCHAYNDHDDGHGFYFKKLAKKVGDIFGITITTQEQKHIELKNFDSNGKPVPKPIAKLTCEHCGRVYYVYKRTKLYKTRGEGYRCSSCHSNLKFEEIK
jgi:predicted SprT family Zn-dependent metalloprotease